MEDSFAPGLRRMPPDIFEDFLSFADASRASRVFEKLARHKMKAWALTGGLAIGIHLNRLGRQSSIRVLNDLDFIAASFDCIPETLAHDFIFRHIHPSDPPGKLILQFIEPDSAVRIDVFRADASVMNRTSPLYPLSGAIQLVAVEDLLARAARLALDLAEGVPTPAKHARDFLCLAEVVSPRLVEIAWQDHRKSKHPVTFAQASSLLRDLIPAHSELLVAPRYSQDAAQVCLRCASTGAFRLADPNTVMASLGYC